jgi:hypothetical protein
VSGLKKENYLMLRVIGEKRQIQERLGGITMEKRKLLTVVLFCFGLAGLTWAAEVINIDLNAQNNDVAYTGEAAIAGEKVWRAFYDGTGIPMGSDRTANLREYDEPNMPSVYAAQVWIAVPTAGTLWEYVGGMGTGLMDDGFKKKAGAPADPCVSILGEPNPNLDGAGAYQGIFDIYVYGATDGNVTLSSPGYGSVTKPLTGGNWDGDFVEDEDYVVFEDVSINDGNDTLAGDGNTVVIKYTSQINGIQMVKLKDPVAVNDPCKTAGGDVWSQEVDKMQRIPASAYDVAGETNNRGGEEQSQFGPDIVGDSVFYLDSGEFMTYDLTVDVNNAGEYKIGAQVMGFEDNPCTLRIYLDDDIYLGDINDTTTGVDWMFTTGSAGPKADGAGMVSCNLFEGDHTITWRLTGDIYFDVNNLFLDRIGDVNMANCDDVYFYQLDYVSDYVQDCSVDAEDLALIVDHWVECFDPNEDNCP